jgi:uncharacterized membrane protein SpoIIM required for sporulation
VAKWRGFGLRLGIAAGISVVGFIIGLEFSAPCFDPKESMVTPSMKALLSTNLTVIISCLVGLVTYGLASVVTLLECGIVYGMQSHGIAAKLGWWKLLMATYPHGVFEIAGLWTAGAVGLGGYRVVRLLKKSGCENVREITFQTIIGAVFALVATFVGAIVEWHNITGL